MTTTAKPSCDTSRNGSTPSGARTCALCSGVHWRTRALATAHQPTVSARSDSAVFRLASVDEGQLRAELRRRGALVAHTVYECSVCGERTVGERRCEECNVFERGLGLGGHCTECEQPILLADLLELEVMP